MTTTVFNVGNKADPSQTSGIRTAFANEIARRYKQFIEDAIKQIKAGFTTNSFRGHKGRPGQVGGSRPQTLSKYSSTQLNVKDKAILQHVKTLQSQIDPADLDKDGFETKPHITVLYGLHTENPTHVEGIVTKHGRIHVTFGPLKVFNAPEHDVLVVSVQSPELEKLHQKLKSLNHTTLHETYTPHLTLAYLRKGTGQKYLEITNPLNSQKTSFTKMVFSDLDRKHTPLTLNLLANVTHDLNPERIEAFRQWLMKNVAKLGQTGSKDNWWAKYIQQAYAKGIARSYHENRPNTQWDKDPAKMQMIQTVYSTAKGQFAQTVQTMPQVRDKVKMLTNRCLTDLEGISQSASRRIIQALVDGMIQGKTVTEIAKVITEGTKIDIKRAQAIAHNELIRAQAEGQLEGMKALGITHVSAAVEWKTTGKKNVCSMCKPMNRTVFKIEEAHGLIPRHPGCCCAWLKADLTKPKPTQKRTKGQVQKAIAKSVKANDKLDWAGKDVDITKRPTANFDPSQARDSKGRWSKTTLHKLAITSALSKYPDHLVRGVKVVKDSTNLAKGSGGAYYQGNTIRYDPEEFSTTIGTTSGDMNGERLVGEDWLQYRNNHRVVPNIGGLKLHQTVGHELGHHIQDSLPDDLKDKSYEVFSKAKVDTPTVSTYMGYVQERKGTYSDAGLSTHILDKKVIREKFAEACRLKSQEPVLYKKLVSADARKFIDKIWQRPVRNSLPPINNEELRDKLGRWMSLAADIPGHVLKKARRKVKQKYVKLAKRYGHNYAKAIVASAIAGSVLPIPGSTFLAAAPMVAVAELHKHLTSNEETLNSNPGHAGRPGHVGGSAPKSGQAHLENLAPELAKVAQEEYDLWDETADGFEDEYAGGGICHLIADRMCEVLDRQGIECQTVDSGGMGEQHVWVIAKMHDGIYNVDIPPGVYETGGGYSWEKIPGVEFTGKDISIDRIDDDPDSWDTYTENRLSTPSSQESDSGESGFPVPDSFDAKGSRIPYKKITGNSKGNRPDSVGNVYKKSLNVYKKIVVIDNPTDNSNPGHKGRPGKRGGSAPKGPDYSDPVVAGNIVTPMVLKNAKELTSVASLRERVPEIPKAVFDQIVFRLASAGYLYLYRTDYVGDLSPEELAQGTLYSSEGPGTAVGGKDHARGTYYNAVKVAQ